MDPQDLTHARSFVSSICREETDGGGLLVVEAAEQCHCLLRALR